MLLFKQISYYILNFEKPDKFDFRIDIILCRVQNRKLLNFARMVNRNVSSHLLKILVILKKDIIINRFLLKPIHLILHEYLGEKSPNVKLIKD